MPVTINGSGNIDGLSVGGLGSGVVNTATLANGAASGSKLTMPTGSVIQTISFIKKDVGTYAATNGSFTATGMSVTITPSSTSNKFLILANLLLGNSGNNSTQIKLYRGTSEITAANSTGVTNKAFIWTYIPQSGDNPTYMNMHTGGGYEHDIQDTNSHEFNLYINSFNTTAYINRRGYSADYGGTSSLTVMEIKG
jgi:hypothetical protein|tara:strand:+ start:524 stop:1111 length:588 start_codon:yes stop_codon:yes gene_type:complete